MKKQFWYYTLLAGVALLLLGILFYASGYFYSFNGTDDVPSSAQVVPDSPVRLGTDMQVSILMTLPEHRRVVEAELIPGQGGTALPARIRTRSWKWDRRVWEIDAVLRGEAPGAIGSGKFKVTVSGRQGAMETMEIPVPPVTLSPLPVAPGTDLALADELPPTPENGGRRAWWWILGAVALLAVTAWLAAKWRRREAYRAIPPWERTLKALEELKSDIRDRRLPPETAWVRLTDLVRNYLEERFRIAASTRTTVEFLNRLDDPGSPVPESERRYLKEFLSTADLIKFARQHTEERLVLEAAAQAGELVRATRPSEPEKEQES